MTEIIVVAIALALSDDVPKRSNLQTHKVESPMECRISVVEKMGKPGEVRIATVELRNIGKEDVQIKYRAHPFEYLDIEVRDPHGAVISGMKYGAVFSPREPTSPQTLTLRPRETYRFTVSVFATTPEEKRKMPGNYRITAIFDDGKVRSVSPAITVTVVGQ
jgi:hypothetical protein